MKISKKKFEKIYDNQVDKIYRFVFLKVGSVDVAQDLTAQTFTKAWKQAKSGLDIENPNAYIFQIAKREIAGYYRQKYKVEIVSADSAQIVSGEGFTTQIIIFGQNAGSGKLDLVSSSGVLQPSVTLTNPPPN